MEITTTNIKKILLFKSRNCLFLFSTLHTSESDLSFNSIVINFNTLILNSWHDSQSQDRILEHPQWNKNKYIDCFVETMLKLYLVKGVLGRRHKVLTLRSKQ